MSSDLPLESLAARLAPEARPLLDALREEARFRYCYYLGVEHLFVALVKSPDKRLSDALTSMGYDSKAVRDGVRRFAGVGGGEEPFAAPVRPTPRLNAIFDAA